MTRVAVIVEELQDPRSGDGAGSGFTWRSWDAVRAVASQHQTAVVELRRVTDAARLVGSEVHRIEVRLPANLEDRFPRLGRALRHLATTKPLAQWEQRVMSELRRWDPDVVVCLGWHPMESRAPIPAVAAEFPTLTYVEEDFSVHPERRKTTLFGRALDRIEVLAWRAAVRRSAAVVIVSERERGWAAQVLPDTPIHHVPLSVNVSYWSEPVPAAGDAGPADVFVIGQYGSERNALGLRDVIEESSTRSDGSHLRFLVASLTPLHPCLSGFDASRLVSLGAVGDPRPYYRATGATLVPSFVVSGAKTTILQGWATRCPVVTTTASADSVGAVDGRDVLAGASAAAVAERLVRLLQDRALSDELAEAGWQRLVTDHSDDTAAAALLRAVDEVASARTTT